MTTRKRTYSVRGAGLHMPRVVRHKTPAAIVRAAARFDASTYDHFARDAMVAAVERDGLWGFALCKPRMRQIHCWVGPRAAPADVVEFFAHELAHLVNDGANLVAWVDTTLPKDERRAEVYAAVAGLAVRLASRFVK